MTARRLLLSFALAMSLFACRDANVDRVDRAAEAVQDKRADLRESGDGLDEATVDPVEHGTAIAELTDAEAEFAARRAGIVDQYRIQHRVFAMQTETARNLLADPTLTDDARQKATDQVLNLERELEEAEQAIDTLAIATAEQWEPGYVTAQTAMMQLEGAHRDAWDVLAVERKLVRPS